MKALITGVSGQDGAYLSKFLLDKGYEVHGLQRRSASNENYRLKYLNIYEEINFSMIDLCEHTSVNAYIEHSQFDEIYNLGAQSFVGTSFDNIITTSHTNSIAVANILESIRRYSPKTKFYQASTSEMFGKVTETPQKETTSLYPRSPYGVSKVYAHFMTMNFRESFGLHASSGILFNHESPLRGNEFVTKKIVSNLCQQKINNGPCLSLGNIEAERDWGYAGDYVEAMYLMLQQDEADDYVIGTGITTTVRDFCNLTLKKLNIDYHWEGSGLDEQCIRNDNGKTIINISPEFFRPAEVDLLLADPSKAEKCLNWKAKTSLNDLVGMMVDYELDKS